MVPIYSSSARTQPARFAGTVATRDYLKKPTGMSSKQLAMGTFLRVEALQLFISPLELPTVSQGKYSEAKTLYERSLVIGKRVYGADHPEVATTLNNLGGLLETKVGHTSTLEMLLSTLQWQRPSNVP